MRHSRFAVLLLAVLTVACGNGVEQPETEEHAAVATLAEVIVHPPLTAEMPDCERTAVHDSGHVVYVVTDRSCASGGPRRVFSLGLKGADAAVQLDMQEGDEIDNITIPSLGSRPCKIRFPSARFRSATRRDAAIGDGAVPLPRENGGARLADMARRCGLRTGAYRHLLHAEFVAAS